MAGRSWIPIGNRCPPDPWDTGTPIQHLGLMAGGVAGPTLYRKITGWTVGTTGSGNYSRMAARTERAAATFGATAQPSGAPDNTLGDSFRPLTRVSGAVAAGDWVLAQPLRASTAAASGAVRLVGRLWGSGDPTGAGAVEISAGAVVGTTVTNLQTGVSQTSTITWPLGAKSLDGLWLFAQLALEIVTASGSASADVKLVMGAGSLTTPEFTRRSRKPIYIVEIDWQRNIEAGGKIHDEAAEIPGDSLSQFVDVTRHLIGGDTFLGRSERFPAGVKCDPGKATVVLRSPNNVYSPYLTGTPAAGALGGVGASPPGLIGTPIRIRTTHPVEDIWAGYIDAIEPSLDSNGLAIATVRATGVFGQLANREIKSAASAGAKTGVLIRQLLTDAAPFIPTTDVVDGDITTGKWHDGTLPGTRWPFAVEVSRQPSLLAALHRLADTEIGLLLEGVDGGLVFQDRSHRQDAARSTASQATWSDADAATLTYERPLVVQSPASNVYNRSDIPLRNWVQVGAGARWVWQGSAHALGETTLDGGVFVGWPLAAGASVTITATLHSMFLQAGAYAETWTTPTLGMTPMVDDIVIHPDYEQDITLTVLAKTAYTMTFTLTNNGAAIGYYGPANARATLIVPEGFGGNELTATPEVIVTLSAEADFGAGLGERAWPWPPLFLPTKAACDTANSYLITTLQTHRTRRQLDLSVKCLRSEAQLAAVLAARISDRHTVVADNARTGIGLNQDFWIENIARHFTFDADTAVFGLSAVEPDPDPPV